MIDAFASAPWYVDHMRPVWLALPPEVRGRFFVSQLAAPAAEGLPNLNRGRLTGDLHPTWVVSYGDMRAVLMAGRQHVALGQHGAGQSYSGVHPAYPGGRGQDAVSMFLCPNDHSAARTRAAYPAARVELVGCPKLDTLPRKERDGDPIIALSFHWSGPAIAPEMRSAWDYYRRALPPLAKRYTVIGHAHPRAIDHVAQWYRHAGIEIVRSFTEVLRRADLYACDNSSSLFEFAATGRPVVVLNTPDYRRNVEHGLRFWEAASVGVNCDRPYDLEAAIAAALEADPGDRERALDIVYQPRTGGAQLSAAALADWAAGIVEPHPLRREVRGRGPRRAIRPIAIRR